MNDSLPFNSARKMMELATQARGLQSILVGESLDPSLRKRLRSAGLIIKTPAGWTLTHQGHIALAFSCAR
jgi:hypothetical protein